MVLADSCSQDSLSCCRDMLNIYQKVKMQYWCIALFFLVSCATAEQGYLLTVPKVIDAGTSERLCIDLVDVSGPGKVTVQLLQQKVDVAISRTVIEFPREEPCFFLEVPNVRHINGRIKVTGEFESDEYFFESESKVSIKMRSVITFVQTDKAVYKPGQNVMFRILTADNQLIPKPVTISKVFIQNPNGIRVSQWLNVANNKGLVQMDMQLNEEPVKGEWKINVEVSGIKTSQVFEVDEYVLPKFEVTVTPPTFILAVTNSTVWKVCAKYTYGKDVRGNMTFDLKYDRNWRPNDLPSYKYTSPINGCTDVTVDVGQMKWNESQAFYQQMKLAVSVEEAGTGVKMEKTSEMSITRTALKLKFKSEHHHRYLKPGLPYFDQIVVSKHDSTPAANEPISVCFYESYNSPKNCQTFYSDSDGVVSFAVPPRRPDIVSFTVEAKAINHQSIKIPKSYSNLMDQPVETISLKTWYSPSGRFLDIKPTFEPISTNQVLPMKVHFTTDGEGFKVNYQVMSRGRIVDHGSQDVKYLDNYVEDESFIKVKNATRRKRFTFEEKNNVTLPDHVGTFDLSFKVTPSMSPIARVLLYYVRSDGEVVAAHAVLNVIPSFVNTANLRFEKPTVLPGENAKYTVSAAPNSLCAVGVVDKSVHLLKTGNQLTKAKVFDIMKKFDTNANTAPKLVNDDKYCREKLKDIPSPTTTVRPTFPTLQPQPPNPDTISSDARIFKRSFPPRSSSYSSKYVDALTAFEVSGQSMSSNLEIESRPCYLRVIPKRRVQFMAAALPRPAPRPLPSPGFNVVKKGGSVSVPESGVNENVEVRTYFPETWLWDLVTVDETGVSQQEASIPHTITEWVGSTVCTSSESGLGISPVTTIKAFQPFFVSFTLPYSVIRKEKVPVTVSVFNYLSGCLPIKLTLEKSEQYTILNNRTHKMCVCGGQPMTHKFRILPTDLDNVNLTVHSHSFSDDKHEVCSQDKQVSETTARDVITKSLLVEPEGFPQESTESVLFCPSNHSDGYSKSFELQLPDDVVEGSERAYFAVSGDIMGPSLSGLEKLVTVPTGCGEQNMITFAPNIFVLQYLSGTNNLSPDLNEKILKNMKTGYQRELNYRHDDGSYSAFGKSDSSGSSWLTAFVVKSFAQSKKYISIDSDDLDVSTKWLISKQQTDGCFPFIGMIHHQDMKGGVGKKDLAPLTAYILISLLEADAPIPLDRVEKAFKCIRNKTDSNAYTLALAAYAAALSGKEDLSNKILNDLYTKALIKDGLTHWTAASKSISVEVGSYVILTHMLLGGSENLAKALSNVRWIAQQRNANGGFVSTQDTVMGLQSFAKFAVEQAKDDQNLELTMDGKNISTHYKINKNNRLLMQKDIIPELSNTLNAVAVGDGCGLMQATLKYNKKSISAIQALEFAIKGENHRECKKKRITVSARYKVPNEESNMALITVKMVSGFIPVKESLKNLKRRSNINLKRYEVDANTVNFYFDHLSNEATTFRFDVEQELDVEDAKPAVATVSDYYIPEYKLMKEYTLPEVNCDVKPHPPFPIPLDPPVIQPEIVVDPNIDEIEVDPMFIDKVVVDPVRQVQ